MEPEETPSAPTSALPSPLARFLAFASILVAGLCGGLIGYAFVDLQCTGDCTAPSSFGGLLGAVFTAGGTAIVAVLVLRAMGEWAGDDPDRLRRPRPPLGPAAEQLPDPERG